MAVMPVSLTASSISSLPCSIAAEGPRSLRDIGCHERVSSAPGPGPIHGEQGKGLATLAIRQVLVIFQLNAAVADRIASAALLLGTIDVRSSHLAALRLARWERHTLRARRPATRKAANSHDHNDCCSRPSLHSPYIRPHLSHTARLQAHLRL